MDNIKDLINELQKFSEKLITKNPPIKDNSIVKTFKQKHILLLPNDFKEFLKRYDGLDLKYEVI